MPRRSCAPTHRLVVSIRLSRHLSSPPRTVLHLVSAPLPPFTMPTCHLISPLAWIPAPDQRRFPLPGYDFHRPHFPLCHWHVRSATPFHVHARQSHQRAQLREYIGVDGVQSRRLIAVRSYFRFHSFPLRRPLSPSSVYASCVRASPRLGACRRDECAVWSARCGLKL